MKRTLQTTILGAVGGLLGFVSSELLSGNQHAGQFWQLVTGTMFWTALYVLPLTLVLLATENVLSMRGRWSRGLWAACVPALVLGALAGGIGQTLFALGIHAGAAPRLIRAIGWAVMGAGIGLVMGRLERSWAKAWRGLVGGAAGGFVGGLLFDSFSLLQFGPADTGIAARAFGLTVLGAAIGSMLRLSQELFKSAWLLGTGGHYEGKQYILTQAAVSLGRSDANDIGLYADPDVPLRAGAFERQGQHWTWRGHDMQVNGQVVTEKALQHGDQLRIGQTSFVFQSKAVAHSGSGVPLAPHQLMLEGAGQIVPLPERFEQLSLGTRGDIKLAGPGVQALHAELYATGGRLELLARGPAALNGQPLTPGQRYAVRIDDQLQLGEQEYQLIRATLVPSLPAQ